jgi:hypothetical protein
VLAAWWWGAEGEWRRRVETDSAVQRTKREYFERVRQDPDPRRQEIYIQVPLGAENDVRWSVYQPRAIVTALALGAFVMWRLEKSRF